MPALPLPAAAPFSARLFRTSTADAWLVGATLGHAIVVAAAFTWAASGGWLAGVSAAMLYGVGLVWGSNTVSHNHLHNPLFRSRRLNRALSAFLSVLLGVPQTIWRRRHMWHHAGEPTPMRRRPLDGQGQLEVALVAAAWGTLLLASPRVFLFVYLPGYAIGLGLCRVQGAFEHAGETIAPSTGGISCYSRVYNVVTFNDGFHSEHHASPRTHWTDLPARRAAARTSRFPPVLRWITPLAATVNRGQAVALQWLEKLALASRPLQWFMLTTHRRALARVLRGVDCDARITVVGGGLFPRTVLALKDLAPERPLTVIDASAPNIDRARAYLTARGRDGGIEFHHARFDPDAPLPGPGADIVIVPLGYCGDRSALYARDAGPTVIVHDWIWRRRGSFGVIISALLLKRLNVVRAGG